MQPDSKKYLFDIQRAAKLVAGFCSGRSFEDYVTDDMLKSAVERQFGIIAFRNILVHGYATVDDRIVWGVVETSLPGLIESVEGLLSAG